MGSGVMTLAAASRTAAFGGHGWHIVEAFVTLFGFLGAIGITEYLQGRRKRRGVRHANRIPRDVLLVLVVLASVAAAGVHFAVMPEHFEESDLYGAFFLVCASVQLVYAGLVLLRPTRSLIAIGALGNAALVLLWLATRTLGVPLGPSAGETESVGALDLIATTAEFIAVAAAFVTLRRSAPPSPAIRPRQDLAVRS
ncbi:MAG TPA: hypothetical protein VHZ96_02755 [Frankiaceae bacterium]|jgi:hypothetical protein|nr:hypothetical protein [Frankiaceae bacterium]